LKWNIAVWSFSVFHLGVSTNMCDLSAHKYIQLIIQQKII
jgi:hypothetical protein